MVGWHQARELGQTPGDGEGQGGLVCCMQPMRLQRVRHDLATEQQ